MFAFRREAVLFYNNCNFGDDNNRKWYERQCLKRVKNI